MKINNFIELIRARTWLGIYEAGIAFALVCMLFSPKSEPFAFLSFCLQYALLASYSFLLNSLCENKIKKEPKAVWLLVLFASAFLLLGFLQGKLPFFFSAFAIFISTAYSARPIFLKGRGILSVIAIGACLASSFLSFSFASGANLYLGLYFALAIMLRQLPSELSHQAEHFEEDAKKGIRTFAVSLGEGNTIIAAKVSAVIFVIYCLSSFAFGINFFIVAFPAMVVFSLHSILAPKIVGKQL